MKRSDVPPVKACHFETVLKKTLILPYLLALPPDATAAKEPLPLLLFLHGMGERGSDLTLLTRHGIPKLLQEGRKLPFLVVAPQCPAESFWTEETEALKALLDHIQRTHAVDPRRIYITGLSMGGFGTLEMALRYPDLFAAAIPVCGGIGSVYGKIHLPRLKNLPLWLFHGVQDTVVPPGESMAVHRQLRALGSRKVRLTLYKDLAHDSWSRTYESEEIYRYLLRHRKPVSRKKVKI